MTKGHGVLATGERPFLGAFESLEIHGDAEGRADLVLPAVATANGAGFVVKNGEMLP